MVDSVNISTGEEIPTAGTTEHLEEMLDVAEASEHPEVSDKPEWLPSKFDTPEDLAEAYRQLEQRLGSGEHLEEDDNAVYDDDPVELEEDPTEITEFLASRDLDFDAFQSEYLENGELSLDESIKKFEDGIKLYKNCRELLDQAEKKISVLTSDLTEQKYQD